MTTTVQVTIDCAHPHTLAEWWAETLGWQVEPQDESFIRRMVDEGHATDDIDAFRASLVRRGATALHEGRHGPHTWVTFTDPEGNEFCA